ncbi:MAG TPA: hypothetical protein V6C81_12270 [Planktothrix sp.]|jgi:hypothetical protein
MEHHHAHDSCGCGHQHPPGAEIIQLVAKTIIRALPRPRDLELAVKIAGAPHRVEDYRDVWSKFAVWMLSDEKAGVVSYFTKSDGVQGKAREVISMVTELYSTADKLVFQVNMDAARAAGVVVNEAIAEEDVLAAGAVSSASSAVMYILLAEDGEPEDHLASQAASSVQFALNMALMAGGTDERTKFASRMGEKLAQLLTE